jgi:hypothetical protein
MHTNITHSKSDTGTAKVNHYSIFVFVIGHGQKYILYLFHFVIESIICWGDIGEQRKVQEGVQKNL